MVLFNYILLKVGSGQYMQDLSLGMRKQKPSPAGQMILFNYILLKVGSGQYMQDLSLGMRILFDYLRFYSRFNPRNENFIRLP